MASRFSDKPAPSISIVYWILWGVFMAVAMPIITALFKRPHEPEDWLLWDKEEAKNR